MRTTLNIDDDLLQAAKIAAVRRRTTLTALLEEALREKLEATPRTAWEIPAHIDKNDPAAVAAFIAYMESKRHNKWTGLITSDATLPPGIDFTSTSTLIEQLEGPFARP